MTFDSAKLTDDQLGKCLQEMRNRGWVVACYDADALTEIIARDDVKPDEVKQWLHEHDTELEQAMCEPIYRAVEEQWPADQAA